MKNKHKSFKLNVTTTRNLVKEIILFNKKIIEKLNSFIFLSMVFMHQLPETIKKQINANQILIMGNVNLKLKISKV